MLAKELSTKIHNPELVSELTRLTSKKENGDDVFLYSLNIDEGSILERDVTTVITTENMSLHNAILQNDPLLSVYLFQPSHSNTLNKPITRIYCDCNIDDSDPKSEIIYFEKGKKFTESISNIPDEKVFVIKTNERIEISDGNNIVVNDSKYLKTVNGQQYYLVGVQAEVSKNQKPVFNELRTTCQRDIHDMMEGVQRFKFDDCQEGWFMGGPEIRIHTLTLDGNTANPVSVGQGDKIPRIYNQTTSDEGKWLLDIRRILNWEESYHGSVMLYHISEKDGGDDDEKWGSIYWYDGVNNDTYYGWQRYGDWADDRYGEGAYEVDRCDWVSPSTWGALYTAGPDFSFFVNTH